MRGSKGTAVSTRTTQAEFGEQKRAATLVSALRLINEHFFSSHIQAVLAFSIP